MMTIKWVFAVFFLAVMILGCGHSVDSIGNDSGPNRTFRLVGAEEIFVDNESENRSVEITYNENNEKLFKDIDNYLIQYTYSSTENNSVNDGKGVPNPDADVLCDLIIEDGRIVEKRFSSLSGSKSLTSDYVILFFYDVNNNIINEQHAVLDNNVNTVVAEIDYKYAYSDQRGDQFLLIEKHYVSNDDNIRVYFRYNSGSEKPDTIEYDVDNDYSIDHITELTYDSYGNQVLAENSDYLYDGGKKSVSTTAYLWEEGVGSRCDLSQIWDDGKTSFTVRF